MSVAAYAENCVKQYLHHVKHVCPDILCPAGLSFSEQLIQPEGYSTRPGSRCHLHVIVNWHNAGRVTLSIPGSDSPRMRWYCPWVRWNIVGRTVLYISNSVLPQSAAMDYIPISKGCYGCVRHILYRAWPITLTRVVRNQSRQTLGFFAEHLQKISMWVGYWYKCRLLHSGCNLWPKP